MIDHCVAEAPNEGCGLVAVADDTVVKVYPTANADASPTGFTVPPEEHYEALRDAESLGWEIGGVFHSHPSGPARPSIVDVAKALDPDWIYLVVAPSAEPELTAWRIRAMEASEVPIERARHTGPMHRTMAELSGFLGHILAAPSDSGAIEMIVRRPDEDERETIETGELDPQVGLVGDNWSRRGEANPATQLTLINSRVLAAVAVERERWPLAGDQIVVDLDLSKANLPPGARLRIGAALVEISPVPHTGCAKFAGRYGRDGLRFVNVGEGRERRFRGMYATVVEGGSFSVGDEITKV